MGLCISLSCLLLGSFPSFCPIQFLFYLIYYYPLDACLFSKEKWIEWEELEEVEEGETKIRVYYVRGKKTFSIKVKTKLKPQ